MFQADPTLPFVAASHDQVVTLVESINQPQISIPTKRAQSAQAFLCGVSNGDGTLSVYAVLYLRESGENVVYAHVPREVTVEDYRGAEAEGLQFLESMGFMLDNLNFRKMAPDQRQRTVQRVPAFSRPSAAAAPRPPAVDPAALARLLASF